MIIIPEIETVVILVPRTGSTSLRKLIKAKYPESMIPYRHMEADGVPHGYDRWKKVGMLRHPLQRMLSLYSYLKNFDPKQKYDPEYTKRMRRSVTVSFDDWLLHNRETFTSPYHSSGHLGFSPKYACHHPLPENVKSQFLYLRPDLGTKIVQYGDWYGLEQEIGVNMEELHVNEGGPKPGGMHVGTAAWDHIRRHMEWDLTTWLFFENMKRGTA